VDVRVVPSIRDVAPDAWDAMLGDGGFYQSHGWLTFVESEGTARTAYVCVWQGDRLVLGLPLYDVRYETVDGYRMARYERQLGISGRHLVAGARRGYRSDLTLRPGPGARAALPAALDAARGLAARAGAEGLVWPYLTTDHLRALGEAAGLDAAFDDAEALFDVPGDGQEAYLAGLTAQRRHRVRRELRAFPAAGWSVVAGGAVDDAELARLLANVEAKYGHAGGLRGLQRTIEAQRRILGERGVLLTCRGGAGELAGFALWYRWRCGWYGRMVGFDYGRLRSAFEYFHLACYEPLRRAAAGGARFLHLGPGALEAKVLRGARLRPLWSAVLPTAGDAGSGAGLRWRRPGAMREYADRFAGLRDALADDEWTSEPRIDAAVAP